MTGISEQLKKKDSEQGTEKAGIAIVDDDLSFSVMLKDYLHSNARLNADLFSSGEDFLREYPAKDDRKIILDYNFGKGLDGLTVLKKIKLMNPNAVVIIVSSNDDLETALETIRNGAIDYFLKSNKTVFANIHCSLIKIIEMEKNKWN